jgi:papain like protease
LTEPVVYRIPEAPDLPHPLGRHVHLDPRSRAFAFTADAAPVLQSVYWPRAVPIFDQGQLGSCTGNAAAGWLATTNALRPGMTETMGTPITEKTAVLIYSVATEIDPYDGQYPPTDTGSDGLSVTKVLRSHGYVDSYQHAFDVSAVLAALMTGPVLVGTVWHNGMFQADEWGVVSISGPVVGGHEYLLVGYDAARHQVTFANSWVTGWADAGYGHMTVATLTALLADDGDATIPHALVTAPVPDPEPVSPPPFLAGLSDRARARMVSRARKAGLTEEQWVTHLVEVHTR